MTAATEVADPPARPDRPPVWRRGGALLLLLVGSVLARLPALVNARGVNSDTAVVGLRMRGWTRRETARPGGRRRPPRVRTGRLASVRGDLAQLPHRFAGVTVVDADVLRVAHGSGREVHVWTVDEPAVMAALLDAGADGILTDRPDLLRDLLQARTHPRP